MARKPRDYKAEEAARNIRARAAGYTSRAQLRNAIETGKASPKAPARIHSPRTVAAQRARYLRALDWSAMHGSQDIVAFDPDDAEQLGITEGEYIDAYMAAFVEGPQRYAATRYKGGSDALRYWYVDLWGYFSAAEYDERYKS